jgi:hypothetical protein
MEARNYGSGRGRSGPRGTIGEGGSGWAGVPRCEGRLGGRRDGRGGDGTHARFHGRSSAAVGVMAKRSQAIAAVGRGGSGQRGTTSGGRWRLGGVARWEGRPHGGLDGRGGGGTLC